MLILLPPSETKLTPTRGNRFDATALGIPGLTDARRRVMSALIEASSRPDACELLGVSARLAPLVEANRHLLDAATAPALEVYSGVLYDALDHATWDAAADEAANRSLRIFSALFGVVGPRDPIPAYRLSGSVNLPGIGSLGAFWRETLTAVLPEDDLIIDCRSGTYTAMWRPAGAVVVRVFQQRAGVRTVVSHMAKHARGLVARVLLHAGTPSSLPEAVERLNDHFERYVGSTATGAPIRLSAELGQSSIDVISDISPR